MTDKPSEMRRWLDRQSPENVAIMKAYRDGDKASAEVEAVLRDAPRVVTPGKAGTKQPRSHWALPAELRLMLDE